MIPELLGNALELFPFTGDGFIHKLEISHGLGLFVFLTWMKYAAASLFETWAIISIVAKIRKSKRFKKLQH
jgi:hypothetical protein